jgi:hypothetical protein
MVSTASEQFSDPVEEEPQQQQQWVTNNDANNDVSQPLKLKDLCLGVLQFSYSPSVLRSNLPTHLLRQMIRIQQQLAIEWLDKKILYLVEQQTNTSRRRKKYQSTPQPPCYQPNRPDSDDLCLYYSVDFNPVLPDLHHNLLLSARIRRRLLDLGRLDDYFFQMRRDIFSLANKLASFPSVTRDMKSELLLVDWTMLTACSPYWAVFNLNQYFLQKF